MVTVKTLKPYYIKVDARAIRVILAYKHFSVLINRELYQFVPLEAKEIRINRKTRKIENIGARFAFQKDKDIIYIAMTKLISLPDFLLQLYAIVESYFARDQRKVRQSEVEDRDTSLIIKHLERENIKRLIDHSLDEKDEEAFYKLVKRIQK
ncbi:MAG TPA: IDEAL domain-containing protein [Bacillota bacterium]|nr:IDEAL domain-containing protein [Bacillota bacterium]